MLRIILTGVQVFTSLAIIGLVLLQRGKGADAGAGFGAGASGTVFGARGATTALSRATAILAGIFMLNSLGLAYMGTRTTQQPKSILQEAGETKDNAAPVTTAPAQNPPAQAPTAAPSSTQTPAPAPAQPPK
ncbi:MAG TPA: preprotein translocase subunit SecG [Steroidobacteraceae bacterium]|nr:preprotein translocase subunit SecG [Steroidobacteraceae bacterium]